MVDVEELEVAEVDQVVVVSAADAVPEVVQLLDDDVGRVKQRLGSQAETKRINTTQPTRTEQNKRNKVTKQKKIFRVK